MIEWASGRTWRVVGIDDAVREVVQAASSDDVGGVVLTGPAGVGKTSLAAAVLAATAASGGPTERLVATPAGRSVPLGALGPLVALADSPHARSQLDVEVGDAVRDRLVGSAPGTRLVLVVDDAPLLDQASAEVLVGLVRAGTVFLVATARTGASLPPVVDGALVEGMLVSRSVAPLGRDDLGCAVATFLGGPVAPEAVATVLDLSSGVPLHARELVQTNVERGTLVDDEGCWRFVRPAVAPPSLVDLVGSRFLQLDEGGRRRFEALCLAQPLPVDAAAALVTLELLADLEDGGLVAVVVEGGVEVVRLGHPLFDDVVRTSLGPVRRRQAATLAAEALEVMAADADAGADVTLRAACLRLDHKLPLRPALAVAAARRALTLADPVLAERLVRVIDGEDFDRNLLLGNALSAQGRHADADAALRAAVRAAGDDEQRARAVSRRGNNLGAGAGDFEAAQEVLAAGLATLTDPGWRSFVEADLAYARSWVGGAGSTGSGLVDAPTSPKPAAVRANECLVGAVVAVMAGRLREAAALVEEGMPLTPAIQHDVPNAGELLQLSRVLALAFGGDRAAATGLVAAELERTLGASEGAPGTWLAVRAMQGLFAGDLHAVVADATDAERRLALADVAGLRPFAQAIRAVAHAQLGDLAGSEAAAASVAPGWRDETKVQILLTQAVAWQEVLAGRTRAAAEQLGRAAELAFAADHVPMGALAAYDAVRLGHPRVVLDLLAGAVERWEGPLGRGLHDHAAALADGRPGALLALAARLPALGSTIGGAEAAMQAARLFEARGQVDAARRAELAAASTVAPLGPITSPTLGRPRGLTAREEQVAAAAAAGRSSRAIAEALGLSPRTVENHLAAVYRKLGVGGRGDLRVALEGLGVAVTSP